MSNSHLLPNIQGILIVSHNPMNQADISSLTKQIIDAEKAKGYAFTQDFKSVHATAGGDVENQTYGMGVIFKEFSHFKGASFSMRIKFFPWSLPGKDSGKFYVVYDRKH